MATPIRKSMRTRKSKRPASPSDDEERRKKKASLAAAAVAPPPPDPPVLVDVVTVTPNVATKPLVVKPKPTVTRQPPPTIQKSSKVTPPVRVAQAKSLVQEKSVTVTPPAPAETVATIAAQKPVFEPATVPTTVPTTPVEQTLVAEQPEYKGHCFKDPNFVHSSKGGGVLSNRKSRVWKTLKQIAAAERSLPWKPSDPTYSSLEAPPSFKPAKKYSDISGFQAKYTDPHTKLRYATTEEFSRLRMLPQDIVTGLLALRKANTEVP
ncbi:uncharacterized protein [Amphiura filiformis]|uniref:uncharacterized protein n=1 Tax=Amphiura filiformis TaxID=82378 RepID=UPI003B20E394